MTQEIVRELVDGEWVTHPKDQSSGPGGAWGEASTAEFSGSGSPVGSVTPSGEGDLYVDTTTPALWQATGATNADWSQVGGGGSQPWDVIKIPFSFDMAGISDIDGPGVATGWTPSVGDLYIAQICTIPTAFDGSNPALYVGKQGFAGGGFNSWVNIFAPVPLSTADFPTSPASGWLLPNYTPTFGAESGAAADAVEQYMYVLDSDDGSDPGNAAGEGTLYFLVIPAA